MIIKTNSCISIYHHVSICTWMPWGCSYFTFIHLCLSMIPYMILLIRPNYSGKCSVILLNIINRREYFDGGWCYCAKYHCIWVFSKFLFFLFFALPSVNYVPSFFVYRESNAVIFLIVTKCLEEWILIGFQKTRIGIMNYHIQCKIISIFIISGDKFVHSDSS